MPQRELALHSIFLRNQTINFLNIEGDGLVLPFQYTSSLSTLNGSQISAHQTSRDPACAPHAPPYFYGKSYATIKYVADGTEGGAGTLNKILSKATIVYTNPELSATLDRPGDVTHQYCSASAYTNAMMNSSSLNLLGKTRLKQVEYDLKATEEGQKFVAKSAKDVMDSALDAWVISPKFETPILNFKNEVAIQHGDAYDLNLTNTAFPAPGPNCYCYGMWLGYGEFCTGSEGLWLTAEDTYPALAQGDGEGTTGKTGSLIDQCGF